MHRLIRNLGIAASLSLLLAGCATDRPRWNPPGPMEQQQLNASLYDPYGDNHAGPEIVGGRPRDFQRPLSEAERSRWFRQSAWWLGNP